MSQEWKSMLILPDKELCEATCEHTKGQLPEGDGCVFHKQAARGEYGVLGLHRSLIHLDRPWRGWALGCLPLRAAAQQVVERQVCDGPHKERGVWVVAGLDLGFLD